MNVVPEFADGDHTDRQRAGLRRMRRMALGLLVLMLALFVACSLARKTWPWLDYPRAFAEAGIVGACADWFAVAALFRHPLGLPIPHTALIPRQKQRIGAALGRFLTHNFLAPAEVAARIERIDVAGWLADRLGEADPVQRLVAGATAAPLLDLLHAPSVRRAGRTLLQRGVDTLDLAPLLARLLSSLMAEERFDPLFDLGADFARDFLETHRGSIRERVVRHHKVWIPGWIDVRLADAILDHLVSTLAAARADPVHPWRMEARAGATRLIGRLSSDAEMIDACARIKSALLSPAMLDGALDGLLEALERWLRAEGAANASAAPRGIARLLTRAGRILRGDARLRDLINDGAHRLALNAVVAGRGEIGAFVAGVVERWDTDTLVNRLELQVGRDLQFIRINGTLVGGLVGLIIFVVTQVFS